jgi:hypothetical protein
MLLERRIDMRGSSCASKGMMPRARAGVDPESPAEI